MSRPLLNRRLEGLGTTIFAEMSARALVTGSVNLGQGFPDRDGPAKIAQVAADAILAGRGNQYPPGPGVPELRQAIAAHDERFYGLRYDPDSRDPGHRGRHRGDRGGHARPGRAGRRGDRVRALLRLLRGQHRHGRRRPRAGHAAPAGLPPRPGRTRQSHHWSHPSHPAQQPAQPDRHGLHPRRAGRHRGAWPSSATCSWSPTRSTSTSSSTASTCRSSQFPGMRERTVSVSSAGKTFSFTGWKIGWVKATPELVTAVKTAKQFLTFVSGGPFQYAVAEALALPDEYYARLRGDLMAQRDLLCAGLSEIGFEVYQPQGTYFVTADVRPLGYAGRRGVLPDPARPRGRGRHPDRHLLRPPRSGPQPRPLRLLQAARGADRGPAPAVPPRELRHRMPRSPSACHRPRGGQKHAAGSSQASGPICRPAGWPSGYRGS